MARKTKVPLAFKHKDYLTLFSTTKNRARLDKLVDLAHSAEIRAISECIQNILQGNVPLEKTSPQTDETLQRIVEITR